MQCSNLAKPEDIFILTQVREKSCAELSLKFQPVPFIRRLRAASSQRWTAAYRCTYWRERREDSRCWRNVTYGRDVSATDDSDLSRGILSNVISPVLRITLIIVLQIPCISCSHLFIVSDVRALRDTLKGHEKKMTREKDFLNSEIGVKKIM